MIRVRTGGRRWPRLAAAVGLSVVLASTLGTGTASASNDEPDESGAQCVPWNEIKPVRASDGMRVQFKGYTYCHNLTGFEMKIATSIGTSGDDYSSAKLCLGPWSGEDFTDEEQCGLAGVTNWYRALAGPHQYCMSTWLRLGSDLEGHTDPGTWSVYSCITYDPADDPEVPPPQTFPDPPVIDDSGGGGGSTGGGGSGGGGTPARADAAMVYDQANASAKIYRWYSTGSAFGRLSDYQSGAFHLSQVGDRVASGDVDGDGYDDVVMAYQLDSRFAFYVFKRGLNGSGQWYVSGTFGLGPVAGRLVVGDWDGDGRAEPALVRDDGDGTMTIWRWHSTGSSFTRLTDYHSGNFDLANVGNRVASGDVDGDGKDDVVMAYQLGDGTFSFYVFRSGTSSGRWYTSGPFGLGPVAGRLVVADFTGDGRAEPALVRDNGDSTMRIYRWSSTGSSFVRATDYLSGTFNLSRVGDRVASGDVTGDGKADIVMAYQNGDGTSTLHVFSAGSSWAGRWYTGGQYNLANVAGRLVVGNWY